MPPFLNRALRRLRAGLRRHGALAAVCVALITAGLWLRVQSLGEPPALTFDEHHFVKNAQGYLAGKADWNDHPPLGKLLIAGSIRLFGDGSFAWRFPSLVAGCVSVLLAYALGRVAFQRATAGALAAAFVAADGFLIAFSRTALLDGVLTCFALAAALAVVGARRSHHLWLGGLAVGLAASIKVSGLTLVGPLALAWLARPSLRRFGWIALLVVPVVYVVPYSYGLALGGKPSGVLDVLADSKRLWDHHLGLTKMEGPLVSSWYTWFLPLNPLTLRRDATPDGLVRMMTSMGHPLLWWGVSGVTLSALGAYAWLGPKLVARRLLGGQAGPDGHLALAWLERHFGPMAWLLACYAAPLAPWVLTRRDSYIYHYLPSYAVGLVVLAGAVWWLWCRRRAAALAYVALVAVAFGFYAPVWGQLPLSPRAIEWRLPFAGWR